MDSTDVVDLNVGGTPYSLTLRTLLSDPSSRLAAYFGRILKTAPPAAVLNHDKPDEPGWIVKISNKSFFIDRDGDMFRHVLNFLRNGKLCLPEHFAESELLLQEAQFYKMSSMEKALLALPAAGNPRDHLSLSPLHLAKNSPSSVEQGHILISYRGTFNFGRGTHLDAKFRKLYRLLVCGKVSLCKEVFGDMLNESRDPDRAGNNQYTSRMYLKHSSLELAFDTLAVHGFTLLAACASGVNPACDPMSRRVTDSEEQRWNHYNEFVFFRPGVA